MPKYDYKLIKCPFCNESRKSTGLHKHIKTHGDDIWKKYLEMKPPKRTILLNDGTYKCSECDFIGKTIQSTSSHWWRVHTIDGKKHCSCGMGIRNKKIVRIAPAWNKGLTKETDGRVKKIGESVSRTIQKQLKNGTYIPKRMGDIARKKLSEKQSLHNSGGKSKWYIVAEKNVQGTYEKLFAETLEHENIKWERIHTNNNIFKYQFGTKIKSYAPDFFLPEYNLYVEIKGHWWGNDEFKMLAIKEQHSDKRLIVILGKEKLDVICKNIRINLPLEPVWSW
jgi:hypothetical protein